MKPCADPAHVEQLRAVVGRRAGLHLAETPLALLSELLRQRVAATRAPGIAAYLDRLAGSRGDDDELHTLAQHLTVGETYFFRDPNQLRAFAEVARTAGRPLRVLSAGCSSGEEAYSLAAVAREHPPAAIVAFDLNPAMIERARRGRYSEWSLRQTPDEIRGRCFVAHGGREYSVVDELRSAVSFEVRNLVDDDEPFWSASAFDVVFLRNVIMYFSPEVARAIVARVARSLVPGGHLFLGHAESLRGISDGFQLRNTHDTFYYERCDAARAAPSKPADLPVAFVAAPIASLPLPSPPPPPPPSPPSLPLALLRDERFADALDALTQLPAERRADADARLLHAALLTHLGRTDDARTACAALLADDEGNAGARHLLSLLLEQAGELDAAVGADRAAAALDATFAMPHLHIGLMARRAGDRRLAQRSLERAIALLAGETAARLLLFGGGFSREALIELCRAELRAAEAAR